MTIHAQDIRRTQVMGMVFIVWLVLVCPSVPIYAQSLELQPFVAVVSNVTGEVSLHTAARARQSKSQEVSLQDPLVYGDHINTAQDSTVSLLVGDDTLISMGERSEVSIEKTPVSPKLIQLMRGETCVSTKSLRGKKPQAVAVKTPTITIYPNPGTMFRVSFKDVAPKQADIFRLPRPTLTEFSVRSRGVFSQSADNVAAKKRVETIEVLHGRVTIESQFGGFSPITVYERYRVEVTDGKIGRQSRVKASSCQIQALQARPQHTTTPKELRQYIAQQHSTQANGLVAALFTPENGIVTTPSAPGWSGVILPTTESNISLSSENIVNIGDEGPVESNTSTVVLTDTQIGSGGSNDINALVSVTSGGLLRGTSTNPVVFVRDSQTTTQSAVEVMDASVLEASAPLIAAFSTDSTSPLASQLNTTGDAVEIAGGQLVASLPADALALVQLNGSSLISSGSLFDITNGGLLAVNGNLVSLTNGSQLGVASLVAISGGSNFGLTGGSLLFGDTSSSVTINNTLCAGGGCTNGFVSAPSGNTISIAPNFQPTRGVDVSPDAALIVVNGTGNTVVLSP